MQPIIIPTLNVHSEQEFRSQLSAIQEDVDVVQIDIADGTLTPGYTTWHDPDVIRTIETPVRYELHLMVEDPRKELARWGRLENIARAVIHAESHYAPVERGERDHLLDAMPSFFSYGFDIAVALNPETPIEKIEALMEHLYYVMLLGVTPGSSGQPLDPDVIEKIRTLREHHPTINIEIDGGVNKETLKEILDAGANILCMGKAIFGNEKTPEESMRELKTFIDTLTLTS